MNTKNMLFAFLSVLFSLTLFSCDSENEIESLESISILKVSDEGISSFAVNNVCPILDATSPLTADEIEFLYALREDEKISRDLNMAFSSLYPAAVLFVKISSAEATHIATIEKLFDYYEIEYPVLNPNGIFTDEYRQNLYNELLAKGNNLENAYRAIASLEEENIVSYDEVLENISNPNIKIIVSNLLKSSRNHLRAIVRQINALGEIYIPTLLDDVTYQDIINSKPEQGKKHSQKGKKGQSTNSEKGHHQKGKKGSVNNAGVCTGCTNGNFPGHNSGKGHTGKGYRGGH